MASRKSEKEAARQRRLEQERAEAAATRRARRLQMVGGTIAAAIAIAVILVFVVGGSGSKSKVKLNTSTTNNSTVASIDKLLTGIPQSGNTLGSPSAKVTVTEYGDLECPICADFAKGSENQLIAGEVRSGKVKLVYKSFPTATSELSNASTIFPLQQSAAYAAGAQNKAWNYIELFYHQQGQEGSSYVDTTYLQGLAKQISGLDFAKWNSERFNPKYSGMVVSETQNGQTLGISATPSIIVAGPKSQTKPVSGAVPYSQLQSMIKSVSS